MQAIDLALAPDVLPMKPIYAIVGDDEFLRVQAWQAIRARVLGGDDEFGIGRFHAEAKLADVLDELAMLPFFGTHRLVLVDDADPFITANRAALERYAEAPHSTGVLVLRVKAWPSNTRLAKIVERTGLAIDCKAPKTVMLAGWCTRWCQSRYGKKLTRDAADLLVELVGAAMGRIDSELDKLAAFVGDRKEITPEDVDRLVAFGRVETVWELIKSATSGDAAGALAMLDRLLLSGEAPIALLGAISLKLRQLAKAARLACDGMPVASAIAEAGVPPYFAQQAQAELRHLGRERLDQLYDWLLETDLGMKGSSELPPHVLIERLLVRVAAPKSVIGDR